MSAAFFLSVLTPATALFSFAWVFRRRNLIDDLIFFFFPQEWFEDPMTVRGPFGRRLEMRISGSLPCIVLWPGLFTREWGLPLESKGAGPFFHSRRKNR